ncbi:MAG: cytidylyltransferase domain-containing protein, partial [Alphaproteobacteria bacterium]
MTRPTTSTLLVIPARLASSRLPGKPLADLDGVPLIVHVWRRAVAADIGPVVVACADTAIADAVHRAGGRAVLTPPELPSGSDRVFHALGEIDPEGTHDMV